MSIILDGTNGITYPDNSVQARSIANTSNILATIGPKGVTTGYLGNGAVLQVVSFNYNSSVSSSSSTLVDSGLTVSITPSSVSSKILVLYNLPLSGGTNNSMTSRTVLFRNSTAIRDISGVFYDSVQYPTYICSVDNCCIVDSPATTSPITYKVQFSRDGYAGSYGGNIQAGVPTGASPINACQITVMEIAA